jgi:hypothetical protein
MHPPPVYQKEGRLASDEKWILAYVKRMTFGTMPLHTDRTNSTTNAVADASAHSDPHDYLAISHGRNAYIIIYEKITRKFWHFRHPPRSHT